MKIYNNEIHKKINIFIFFFNIRIFLKIENVF